MMASASPAEASTSRRILETPKETLLTLQVVLQKSLKFDSRIVGSAWVDDVSAPKLQ